MLKIWRALCAFYIYYEHQPTPVCIAKAAASANTRTLNPAPWQAYASERKVNCYRRKNNMKYIRIIMPVLMIFFLLAAGVCAQRQEAELLTALDLSQPVRQMVWDAPENELMLLSGVEITGVNLSDPGNISTCQVSDESYSLLMVSDPGVLAAMTKDRQQIDLYASGCSEKPERTIIPGFQILSFMITKDGKSVLVNSAEEIRTVVYDVETGETVYDLDGFETAAPVYDSMLSGDGKFIVWHARGTFAVQNTADGSFGKTISLWDFASSYTLSLDNKTLAVAIINDDYENGAVMFFDPEKGTETGRTILGKIAPFTLVFSADNCLSKTQIT